MEGPVRVTGPEQFSAAIRRLERDLPVEVDALVTEAAEETLPTVREYTPVGSGRSGPPGRLRDATTVVKVRGRPGFMNRQPYANTEHWGRRRRGVVRGTRFVVKAVEASRPLIEQTIERGLNRLLSRLP